MASLLRRRLTCFYCGCRSAQKYAEDLRRWECGKCEAVNYLDEKGEIADPPPLETTSNVRYAQSIQRPNSPVFTSMNETLFCPTCIKNQHIFTQTLASYLPSTADPEYPEYEASYPAYKKSLEERYPQVCEHCEPRVRARIQATGYAARTDHLRRMMESSRSATRSHSIWDLRWLAFSLGAILWWTSIALQLQWNAMGAIAASSDIDSLREVDGSDHVVDCFLQSLMSGEASQKCIEISGSLTGSALVAGAISIWWNPCLSSRLHGRRGRILGLSAFYRLQTLAMLVRAVACYVLVHKVELDLDEQVFKALHALMLVFNAVTTILSYRTVRMDYSSRVLFQDSQDPLIIQSGGQNPANTLQKDQLTSQNMKNPLNTHPQSFKASFPISKLAPALQQRYPAPYNPPTPPPEDDEMDTMDWTPTQDSFRPAPSAHILQPIITGGKPSPFYGRLPPAPISQAHQLRNPPNQPKFRRTSTEQRKGFFKRMTSKAPTVADDDSEYQNSEFEGEDDGVASSPASPTFYRSGMAAPKFFPQSDYCTDTGLESVLNTTFSLKDEPDEVRAVREGIQKQDVQASVRSATNRAPWQRVFGLIFLLASWLAWSVSCSHSSMTLYLRLGALGVVTTIAGRGLIDALQMDKEYWRLSDILLFAIELIVAIILGSAVNWPSRAQNSNVDILNYGPMWFLGGMIIQEILIFANELRDASELLIVSPSERIQPHDGTAQHASTTNLSPPAEDTPPIRKERRRLPLSAIKAPDNGPSNPQLRITRSKSKRESLVPSSNLSNLSLGLGKDANPTLNAPKFASWGGGGGGGEVVARNTRANARVQPWNRGTL